MFFMQSMKKIALAAKLERLEKEMQSARITGAKECNQCGYCCHQRSCTPNPEEIIIIAEFLGLTVKELIKTKMVVDFGFCTETVFILRWVGVNVLAHVGSMVPNDLTFDEGHCIFLTEDNKCLIHPVKPQEAKDMQCWNDKKFDYNVYDHWKDEALLKRFGIDGSALYEQITNPEEE